MARKGGYTGGMRAIVSDSATAPAFQNIKVDASKARARDMTKSFTPNCSNTMSGWRKDYSLVQLGDRKLVVQRLRFSGFLNENAALRSSQQSEAMNAQSIE